ncbi:MAG: NTP transferase domain-containing protein [Alphaproteobacteria bacterium]|nr:NTP transferase domain-containing protein [Alphaproteobacteria bacterium]
MPTGAADIPSAILAGGAARRFGSPKGLALLNGKPMIAHVVGRLRAQTRGPIAVVCDAEGRYGSFADAVLEDAVPGGQGPLAGLLAALRWADGLGATVVATAPIDAPFLPANLISALAQAGAPAIAAQDVRDHPVCGLWAVEAAPDLEAALTGGMRAVHAWTQMCAARRVAFDDAPPHAFFNVNTQEDLARAEALIIR